MEAKPWIINMSEDLWRVNRDKEQILDIRTIPSINFPSHWQVQIIPPFRGATVRFMVNDIVSVYLDRFDNLGFMGEPYWEIYPGINEDPERFLMNDVEGLLEAIELAISEVENE